MNTWCCWPLSAATAWAASSHERSCGDTYTCAPPKGCSWQRLHGCSICSRYRCANIRAASFIFDHHLKTEVPLNDGLMRPTMSSSGTVVFWSRSFDIVPVSQTNLLSTAPVKILASHHLLAECEGLQWRHFLGTDMLICRPFQQEQCSSLGHFDTPNARLEKEQIIAGHVDLNTLHWFEKVWQQKLEMSASGMPDLA